MLLNNGTSGPTVQTDSRKWLGPSMCHRQNSSSSHGWRNTVLSEVQQQLRLQHVHVQPFEDITRERWDYHASAVWNGKLQRWASDCTHLCYSPSFWELSFHDLYTTIVRAAPWLSNN